MAQPRLGDRVRVRGDTRLHAFGLSSTPTEIDGTVISVWEVNIEIECEPCPTCSGGPRHRVLQTRPYVELIRRGGFIDYVKAWLRGLR